MAIFICNACGHSKTVRDELIGKKAQCPKCKAVNRITASPASKAAAPAPASPEPMDPAAELASAMETPRKSTAARVAAARAAQSGAPAGARRAAPASRAASAAMKPMDTRAGASGFGMLFWATMLPVMMAVGMQVMMMTMGATGQGMSDTMTGLVVFQIISYLVQIACFIMTIVALVRLGKVTRDRVWKSKSKAALLCYIIAAACIALVVVLAVTMVASMAQGSAGGAAAAGIFMMVLYLAAGILGVIYMFKVLTLAELSGRMFGNGQLVNSARSTRGVFKALLWVFLAYVITMLLASQMGQGAVVLVLGAIIAMLILGLIFLIKLLITFSTAASAYRVRGMEGGARRR